VLEKTDTYRMLWNIAVRKLECFGHAVTKVEGRSEKALVRRERYQRNLECGPMPNVLVALPNIDGALCSTSQNFADAHY